MADSFPCLIFIRRYYSYLLWWLDKLCVFYLSTSLSRNHAKHWIIKKEKKNTILEFEDGIKIVYFNQLKSALIIEIDLDIEFQSF